MNIKLLGDVSDVLAGVRELANELKINLADGGYEFTAERRDEPCLEVCLNDKKGFIAYSEKCQFFRALGIAIEHIRDGEESFSIVEKPQFRMNGPQIDISQGNAALNKETVKEFIRLMAIMGMNMIMLYCEDSFEVKEQPYFGYMRARYSQEELRELDEYADMLGLEMIPCVQTLAHLPDTLRWKCFRSITDYEECLLVGEEKTYEFIEDLIKAAAAPFKTKRINILMDEALKLGRGRYLDKNGYRDPSDIMKEHLARVMQILDKYGLEPFIASDMFYCVYGTRRYRQATPVPDYVKELVPKSATVMYWDYYSMSQAEYERVIDSHFDLHDKVLFMGGIWTWIGYSLAWEKTLKTTEYGLNACKKKGIKDIIVTTWGDNGTESLIPTTLIGFQLFAEHGYADEFDYEKFKKRFNFCTGGRVEDFENLELLDKTPDTLSLPDHSNYNPSKWIMWQDILTGLGDKNIEGVEMNAHYEMVEEKLKEAVGRNGRFDYIFEYSRRAAHVLAVKAEMGIRLVKAYKDGDKAELKRFADEYLPDLKERVLSLREYHKDCWFKIYKAFGWDIMDLRYGTLIMRITSAIEEVNDYLNGKLERLEELEEERRYFDGIAGPIRYMNGYGRIVSPSRIAPDA
ncbi:MAG: beta-N-acetylhexosaminidase [Ruminococcaceae bacterium]|nr:beta-N-acetylhexosaminidase [Oscillospiraceae bacterium]